MGEREQPMTLISLSVLLLASMAAGSVSEERPAAPLDTFALGEEIAFLRVDGKEIFVSGIERTEKTLRVPPVARIRRPVLSSSSTVDLLIRHDHFDAVWRLGISASGDYELELLWRGRLRSHWSPQAIDPDDPSRFLLFEDPSRYTSDDDAIYLVRDRRAIKLPSPPQDALKSKRINTVRLAQDRIVVATGLDTVFGTLVEGAGKTSQPSVRWETFLPFPSTGHLPLEAGWVGFVGGFEREYRRVSRIDVFDEQGNRIGRAEIDNPELPIRFGNGVIAFNRLGDALVFSGGQTYRIGIPPGIELIDSLAGSRALAWDQEAGKAWWIDIPPPPEDRPPTEEAEPPVEADAPEAAETAAR